MKISGFIIFKMTLMINTTNFTEIFAIMASDIDFNELVQKVLSFMKKYLHIEELSFRMNLSKSNNETKKIINKHIKKYKKQFIILRVVNTSTVIGRRCTPYMFSFISCLYTDDFGCLLFKCLKKTDIVFEDIKSHDVRHRIGYDTKMFVSGKLEDVHMYDEGIDSLNLFEYRKTSLFRLNSFLFCLDDVNSVSLKRLISLGFNIHEDLHYDTNLLRFYCGHSRENYIFVNSLLDTDIKSDSNVLIELICSGDFGVSDELLDTIQNFLEKRPNSTNTKSSRFNQKPIEYCIDRGVDLRIVNILIPFVRFDNFHSRVYSPFVKLLSKNIFKIGEVSDTLENLLNQGCPINYEKSTFQSEGFYAIDENFITPIGLYYSFIKKCGRSNEIENFTVLNGIEEEKSKQKQIQHNIEYNKYRDDYYDDYDYEWM